MVKVLNFHSVTPAEYNDRYTGKDLLNPSCWPQPVWTPTVCMNILCWYCSVHQLFQDHSFVGAITERGWEGSPKCFDFLERELYRRFFSASLKTSFLVCNGPKKCIFVRVVDTCAGCAPGSKHVDLTKAAFTELASIDQGVLSVDLRPAPEPKHWNEDLWGPK